MPGDLGPPELRAGMPSVRTCRLGASLAAEHREEPRAWGLASQDGFASDGAGMLLSRITEHCIRLSVSLPRWVSSESPSLVHLYFPGSWRLQALTLMSYVRSRGFLVVFKFLFYHYYSLLKRRTYFVLCVWPSPLSVCLSVHRAHAWCLRKGEEDVGSP